MQCSEFIGWNGSTAHEHGNVIVWQIPQHSYFEIKCSSNGVDGVRVLSVRFSQVWQQSHGKNWLVLKPAGDLMIYGETASLGLVMHSEHRIPCLNAIKLVFRRFIFNFCLVECDFM